MFLRCNVRKKNGKEHRYWSVVENRRVSTGKVVQRHVLYLGEINDSQQMAWRKSIQIFGDGAERPQTISLFPEDRIMPICDETVVKIRLKDLALKKPRQWGACWLACHLYEQLGLDRFWKERLTPSRKGTRWDLIMQAMVCYRLIDPGSEWRLHREWFERSAMGDLLGGGYELVEIHKLYECLDLLLAHQKELFDHLTRRWKDLFNASYEVLLYDLTSTYFETDTLFSEEDKRKYGYSRDKRSDCVQVVIALVVTPEGFPLAYEVLRGNTRDSSTLAAFLKKIEDQHGKAKRIWVMDRGIPTEETLAMMRKSDYPMYYLVGTPKGRLSKLEKDLVNLPWKEVREGVQVKLLDQEKEMYVFAESRDRINKERSMRRRQLKKLWKRLKELQASVHHLKRDELMLKLGSVQQQSPSAWRLVQIEVIGGSAEKVVEKFHFALRKDRLRQVRQREGRYLLRTNLCDRDPAQLWSFYMVLVQVEESFKNLKGDLAIRPIFHQKMQRVEAHIFVAFVAYALHVTLRQHLKYSAPGLTPRAVLEKFRAIQMVDVHLPTTDGRTVILSRHTQPEPEHQVLLNQLHLTLPDQPPPPKIRST